MLDKYILFILNISFLMACQPDKKIPKEIVVKTIEPVAPNLMDSMKVDEKLSMGKLFLIGGGQRPLSMMETMIRSAEVDTTDFIGVLTMASSNPDSAFYEINQQFIQLGYNHVVKLNISKIFANNPQLADSVKKAKLLFITGGDQNLFMEQLDKSLVKDALLAAYLGGATIAGTGAGAAVVSKIMLTGNQKYSDVYSEEHKRIWNENAITSAGMGFIDDIIIDEHFIVQNGYNRMLTAMASNPKCIGIGIDEKTGLLIFQNTATVVGESQVVIFHPAASYSTSSLLLGLRDLRIDIYTPNQTFKIE
jgi:cyanophycinase